MSVAVLQDLWTAIGFTAKRALARHVIVAILVAGLVFGFAAVHAEWSPMHRWNRAFGDASLILIALAISLGPLTRFLRSVTRLLPFRRELGIQACLLVIVHAAIILVVWVELDLMRLFGFEWHPDLLIYVMFQHGFGLGNAVGLAAFALAILLAATSSDHAMRRLGVSAWKFLQMGVLPLWWLTVAHVAYFLFMHFLSFQRAIPEPNPLRSSFVGLVLFVIVVRVVAFVRTARRTGTTPSTKEGYVRAPS